MTFYLNLLSMLIPMKSIRKKKILFFLLKTTTQNLYGKRVQLSIQAKWNVFYPVLSLLWSVNFCVTQQLTFSILSGGKWLHLPYFIGITQGQRGDVNDLGYQRKKGDKAEGFVLFCFNSKVQSVLRTTSLSSSAQFKSPSTCYFLTHCSFCFMTVVSLLMAETMFYIEHKISLLLDWYDCSMTFLASNTDKKSHSNFINL